MIASQYSHLAEINDFLLLRLWVNFDDAQGRTHPQSAIENINAENNRVTLTERGNDLEATWPDSLWCRISPLRLDDLIVVRREGVEQVVDDVRCRQA